MLQALLNLTTLLSTRDLERAEQPRPGAGSHVHGTSAAQAFAGMNAWLESAFPRTRSCKAFSHGELNAVLASLYELRAPELHERYAERGDRRGLYFESLEEKRALWAAEEAAQSVLASHRPGGAAYDAIRDGKCAEVVMVFVHHLNEEVRSALARDSEEDSEDSSAVELPLMPRELAPERDRSAEYERRIGCTSCHVAVHIPGEPDVTPIPYKKNASEPQYPTSCPVDLATGEPVVYYDRRRRCDWDYEPFCAPCEGTGGMIWGPGREDWLPMPCEVVAAPGEIRPENLTSPLWPRHFTVEEKAALTFPGADPCSIDFKNSTYTLRFDTDSQGLQTYYDWNLTRPDVTVADICTEGLLKVNLSCIAPNTGEPPAY